MHRHITDDRAETRIIVVLLLVGIDEGCVLLGLDLVPRIACDDPTNRSLILERIKIFGLAGEQAHYGAVLEDAASIAFAHELGEIAAEQHIEDRIGFRITNRLRNST